MPILEESQAEQTLMESYFTGMRSLIAIYNTSFASFDETGSRDSGIQKNNSKGENI